MENNDIIVSVDSAVSISFFKVDEWECRFHGVANTGILAFEKHFCEHCIAEFLEKNLYPMKKRE